MTLDIVRFVDSGLGNSSYLVGSGDGRALAVDPQRDPARYLAAAEGRGWVPAVAVETHLHADFISGGRELQELGSTLYAPAGSRLAFDHRPVAAGQEIALGGLTIRALPTPGHTPEHLSYLVDDGGRPQAFFSGGSLLTGSVARTDLISPEATEELTRRMFRSLREVLAPLPDDLAVYPTHGAGSFCTAGASGDRATTLGAERAHNPYLGILEEDEFVSMLLGSLGSYPTYYRHLRERNRSGPRVYGPAAPTLDLLSVAQLEKATRAGAVVVDARPGADWAAGHVPESLSIPLRDSFAPWVGWLVDIDTPLVLVLGRDQDRADVVLRCRGIGYERLLGELDGGADAWAKAGKPLAATPTGDFSNVDGRTLIDVRQRTEWEAGHIPGGAHIELGMLTGGAAPPTPLAVHCRSGERASTAASILERAGRDDVLVVTGGPEDWRRATGRSLSTT